MTTSNLLHGTIADIEGTDQVPRFSVVMPALNAENTIARAISSVLAQSRSDWELLVVDDGSSDATSTVARKAACRDPRIMMIEQDNAGVAKARNTAVSLAHGEFICVLDSDDEMLPDYLETMSTLIDENPDCALYSVNARCVEPSGAVSLWRSGPRFSVQRSFSLYEVLRGNPIFITATIRTDVFRSLGGMDSRIPRAEDYDLWLRLLAAGHRHIYTPQVRGVYHRQPGSLSSSQLLESVSIVQIMDSLINRGVLSSRERRLARRRIRSAAARAELERRRLEGDRSGGRLAALATVPAFISVGRRIAGTILALLGPKRFFRIIASRRNRQLEAFYAPSADERTTGSQS